MDSGDASSGEEAALQLAVSSPRRRSGQTSGASSANTQNEPVSVSVNAITTHKRKESSVSNSAAPASPKRRRTEAAPVIPAAPVTAQNATSITDPALANALGSRRSPPKPLPVALPTVAHQEVRHGQRVRPTDPSTWSNSQGTFLSQTAPKANASTSNSKVQEAKGQVIDLCSESSDDERSSPPAMSDRDRTRSPRHTSTSVGTSIGSSKRGMDSIRHTPPRPRPTLYPEVIVRSRNSSKQPSVPPARDAGDSAPATPPKPVPPRGTFVDTANRTPARNDNAPANVTPATNAQTPPLAPVQPHTAASLFNKAVRAIKETMAVAVTSTMSLNPTPEPSTSPPPDLRPATVEATATAPPSLTTGSYSYISQHARSDEFDAFSDVLPAGTDKDVEMREASAPPQRQEIGPGPERISPAHPLSERSIENPPYTSQPIQEHQLRAQKATSIQHVEQASRVLPPAASPVAAQAVTNALQPSLEVDSSPALKAVTREGLQEASRPSYASATRLTAPCAPSTGVPYFDEWDASFNRLESTVSRLLEEANPHDAHQKVNAAAYTHATQADKQSSANFCWLRNARRAQRLSAASGVQPVPPQNRSQVAPGNAEIIPATNVPDRSPSVEYVGTADAPDSNTNGERTTAVQVPSASIYGMPSAQQSRRSQARLQTLLPAQQAAYWNDRLAQLRPIYPDFLRDIRNPTVATGLGPVYVGPSSAASLTGSLPGRILPPTSTGPQTVGASSVNTLYRTNFPSANLPSSGPGMQRNQTESSTGDSGFSHANTRLQQSAIVGPSTVRMSQSVHEVSQLPDGACASAQVPQSEPVPGRRLQSINLAPDTTVAPSQQVVGPFSGSSKEVQGIAGSSRSTANPASDFEDRSHDTRDGPARPRFEEITSPVATPLVQQSAALQHASASSEQAGQPPSLLQSDSQRADGANITVQNDRTGDKSAATSVQALPAKNEGTMQGRTSPVHPIPLQQQRRSSDQTALGVGLGVSLGEHEPRRYSLPPHLSVATQHRSVSGPSSALPSQVIPPMNAMAQSHGKLLSSHVPIQRSAPSQNHVRDQTTGRFAQRASNSPQNTPPHSAHNSPTARTDASRFLSSSLPAAQQLHPPQHSARQPSGFSQQFQAPAPQYRHQNHYAPAPPPAHLDNTAMYPIQQQDRVIQPNQMTYYYQQQEAPSRYRLSWQGGRLQSQLNLQQQQQQQTHVLPRRSIPPQQPVQPMQPMQPMPHPPDAYQTQQSPLQWQSIPYANGSRAGAPQAVQPVMASEQVIPELDQVHDVTAQRLQETQQQMHQRQMQLQLREQDFRRQQQQQREQEDQRQMQNHNRQLQLLQQREQLSMALTDDVSALMTRYHDKLNNPKNAEEGSGEIEGARGELEKVVALQE